MAGHLLVLAAVLVCLRLGWWQWDRSQELTGTAQNLGYAFLWPAFAASFIYMWFRFLTLEAKRDQEDDERLDEDLARLTGSAEEAPEPAADAGTDPATDLTIEPDQQELDPEPGPGSRSTVISTALVGDDEDADPELAAYNRALAELAEKDRRAR